ncbi:MAG: discoidin domain-containing protein, partial [Candidatus Aureabacteria bacterium]|nr:discoidin domain-containing protein [Candidatus Auribacterota bacterium]
MDAREIRKYLQAKSIVIFACIWMMPPVPDLLAQPVPTPPSSLTLKVFATTMTQIVLKWDDPSENAISYELQRGTGPSFSNPTHYTFAKDSMNFDFKLFSDTNRAPESNQQFSGLAQYALLDKNTTYYYRITASRSDGSLETSNIVSAKVSEPVRGVEGDLWADVVIGKPDFAQNSQRKTNASASRFAGGVLIDHNHNTMYIADTNNNRILGIDRNSLSGYSKVGPIHEEDNLARDASYTKSIPPDANYPDTGNAEFTDGQASTTWTNSFGYFPGGNNIKTVDINVDLGDIHEINFTSLSNGGGTTEYCVGKLTVSVSSDGAQWTEVGTVQNTDRQGEIIIVFLPAVSARHVRFRAVSYKGPDGIVEWMFIGEGRVGKINAEAIQEQWSMTPCAKNSDCCCGNHCEVTENPSHPADIVIGQPEMEDHSAGNGDSTCQTFPYRAPAGSASLCLIHPTQISMAETTTW